MSEKSYETVELPGVGEIRARPGTSTLELAGAAKHWHTKFKTAWVDGAIAGGGLVLGLEVIGFGIYSLIRILF